MWPILFVIDLASMIVYMEMRAGNPKNIFTVTCLWVTIWSSFFMMLQYVKCSFFEKIRHDYPFIEGHERETIDQTLHLMEPEELTEKSKKLYSKIDIGTDLNALAFKTLHLATAKEMKYSLENIMQSQAMVFAISVVQTALAISFYINYTNTPNFSVTQPPRTTVMIGRMCCAMVLHVQTVRMIRQGLEMMKFALDHPLEFTTPCLAAMVGFFHAVITMLLTFAIIIHISAQTTFLDTLTAFVTYTATCMVPSFAAASLPMGHVLKPATPDLFV